LDDRFRVEDKRGERPVRVDADAVRKDYAAALQDVIDAHYTDANASERARNGWITRLRRREAFARAAEAQAPVGPTDPRVARTENVAAKERVGAANAADVEGTGARSEDLSDVLAQAIVAASAGGSGR
jgi:hypothetical protein